MSLVLFYDMFLAAGDLTNTPVTGADLRRREGEGQKTGLHQYTDCVRNGAVAFGAGVRESGLIWYLRDVSGKVALRVISDDI